MRGRATKGGLSLAVVSAPRGRLVGRLLLAALSVISASLSHARAADVTILNVSYDPTREFYTAFNKAFAEHWREATGEQITVEQSHGGSGAQARAVMNGLDADVVTLGIASDIDALAKTGLVAKNWQGRLPNDSCPYMSTVVFLVRNGNPKRIRDWDDLARQDVAVITPNPKTSSGGRWSFLAAWGWALDHWGGDQGKAQGFVSGIYKRSPVLEAGARGATIDFTRRGLGDVLLTWENEAMLAMHESGIGKFEIVWPSESILAQPPVAMVDQTVGARGTRGAAEAYLNFLYSDAGQELAAENFYRPSSQTVAARHADQFPPVKLFTVADKFGSWDTVQSRYFADGGIFDRIYAPR